MSEAKYVSVNYKKLIPISVRVAILLFMHLFLSPFLLSAIHLPKAANVTLNFHGTDLFSSSTLFLTASATNSDILR